MHNHQTEIVCECICEEEPIAGQVLKPYLGFRLAIFADILVNERQTATFALSIDFKCKNLPKVINLNLILTHQVLPHHLSLNQVLQV